ncbi:hypothetical protein [Actinoplanes sp. NPDC026670]|uniref:hypothetical protein n=1 Tax=Actinoplanes sp. NPDC026670 TaxID=3154700 RepID=UPI0033CF0F9B
MRAFVSTFAVPKSGSTTEEYEDASHIEPADRGDADINSPWLAAAVADGASEAMLAGHWARHLTTTFTAAPADQNLTATILAAAADWDEVEAEYRQARDTVGEPIAWYEEDGLRRGAYATIVGAHLLDGPTRRQGPLLVAALGDACLFQIRDNDLITAFPIDDPAGFDTRPSLAPSRPRDPAKIGEHVTSLRTDWQQGDQLLLASDALAQWFLAQAQAGGTPWLTLSDLGTDAEIGGFAALIDGCRTNGSLKNDDTTLLRIDL